MTVHSDVRNNVFGRYITFSVHLERINKQSLPAAGLQAEAKQEGILFSCGGDTHWSNLKCMKEVCDTNYILGLLSVIALHKHVFILVDKQNCHAIS